MKDTFPYGRSVKDFLLPGEPAYGQIILDAIREGMAPFQMKMVSVQNSTELDFNRFRVTGSATLMSGYTYNYSEFVDRDDFLDNTNREMMRVAESFRQKFRNRSDSFLLGPNIYLGAN